MIATCDAMRCVGFSGMLLSFVTTLCSPNEDFGNPKNILDRLFGHYFKGVSTSFGRLLLENVLKKMVQNSRVPLLPHFDKPAFSRIPQTFQPRFVVHNFWEFVKRQVCQNGGGVAHGWSKMLSGFPKSSFGEHKQGNTRLKLRTTCD